VLQTSVFTSEKKKKYVWFLLKRIHPSIVHRLAKIRSWRQQVQERNPDSPLSAPPGGSQNVYRLEGIYNHFIEFWVCPRASSHLDMPGKPSKEGELEGSESDARNTSADSFWCGGASTLLQALSTSNLISKGEPSQHLKETHFSRLYPRPRSLGQNPDLWAQVRVGTKMEQ